MTSSIGTKRLRDGTYQATILGITWYKKQSLAFEENQTKYDGDGFVIKNGPFFFGCVPNIDEFILRYMERKTDLEIMK